jgi:hypothetical protein
MGACVRAFVSRWLGRARRPGTAQRVSQGGGEGAKLGGGAALAAAAEVGQNGSGTEDSVRASAVCGKGVGKAVGKPKWGARGRGLRRKDVSPRLARLGGDWRF